MEKYAIYTYKFTDRPTRNGTLPLENTKAIEGLSQEQRFELLFGKETGAELRIQRIKSSGTADKYPCRVLKHDEHIILLRLVNPHDVGIWEEQLTDSPISKIEKTTRKTNPYCYIVIDNRPDKRIIAIQTASAAWRSTNDIRNLMEESLNRLLDNNDYGLEVSIQSKMLPSKFWEYVNKKRKTDNVYIKSMVFSFTNHKRRPDIDIKQALSSEWKHFESFIVWMDKLGGDRGEIKIIPPKNEELMKRKLADIKHMVEICMSSYYTLTVTFSDDITYKCNQELRAEFPMDDKYWVSFMNGEHDLFNHSPMMRWLDDVIEKAKIYQNVEDNKPKPGRKAQKSVS